MSAIDQVTAHFEKLGRREIEVPEWGLTVYSSPITVRNRMFLEKKRAQSEAEYSVDLVMLKARDADGEPLFEGGADRNKLLEEADSAVIGRLALAILAGPSLDETKKN